MVIEVDCPDCGSIFPWQPHGNQKARSPEQHRRFFLMVTLGYRNLPTGQTKYVNVEHYRAMVTMRSDPSFREVHARLPVPADITPQGAYNLVRAVLAACVAGGLYLHVQVEGSEIVMYRAKSVSWLQMGHRTFNFLNELVQELIEKDTGRSVDEMIAEHVRNKEARKAELVGRERAPRDIGREF